jgi:Protein of unknown function (DUF1064)
MCGGWFLLGVSVGTCVGLVIFGLLSAAGAARGPGYLKYRHKPETYDGYHFDSQREMKRYVELRLLEQSGVIRHLCADKRLLRHLCVVNGVHVCTYEADFRYEENGQAITEDCEEVRTPEYQLKKALVFACLGVAIRET